MRWDSINLHLLKFLLHHSKSMKTSFHMLTMDLVAVFTGTSKPITGKREHMMVVCLIHLLIDSFVVSFKIIHTSVGSPDEILRYKIERLMVASPDRSNK